MKNHYPSEKFSAAVKNLALGLGSLQERVASAFTDNLHLLLDHQAVIPEQVLHRLKDYEAAWRAVGGINVWASRLSDDQATDIAGWILEMSEELSQQFWSDA